MQDKFIREAKYNVIKKRINFRLLLKKLKIDFNEKANELWACCPFHEERSPSWSINNDKTSDKFGHFKCFGCGEGGDWIKLIEHEKDFDNEQAMKYAKAIFGIGDIDEKFLYQFTIDERKERYGSEDIDFQFKPIKLAPEFNRLILEDENASPYWKYVKGRNISSKVILEGNYMYCKGIPTKKEFKRYQKRFIIPITVDEVIVSFFARSILQDCEKKYRGLYPPDSPIGRIMHGYDDLDYDLDYCIIVEGPIDRDRMKSLGYKNVLGTLGNQMTKYKINIIKRFKNIWVVGDADAGGEILEQTVEPLKFKHNIFAVDLPEGEDPGSSKAIDIKKAFINKRKITEKVGEFEVKIDYKIRR